MQESQLRKKPRQIKVEVEEKEDKASFSLTATLQAHAQSFEGDEDFFELEQEQGVQKAKRNLSTIFGPTTTTEETTDIETETAPKVVVVGEGVDCSNNTVDECDLDLDLEDCEFFEDEETEALMCFITLDDEEKDLADTLDYKDNPLLYPDVSYDYEDAEDEDEYEDEEKRSKSGKQLERKLKKKKHEYEDEGSESGSELVISTASETERARQEALDSIDLAEQAVQSANNLRAQTRETCILQIQEVRAAVSGTGK